MVCVDQDTFGLTDHGKSADVALEQLMKIPAIAKGALGTVIKHIQWAVLPISEFNWVPQQGNNAGSAAGFFQKDYGSPNKLGMRGIKIVVMEDKRSQVVHELVHGLDIVYYYFNISHPPLSAKLAKRVPVIYLFPLGDVFKYNFMDLPFVDDAYISKHSATLTYCANLIKNNSLLKDWQRSMLMTQLNYAARPDKVHVEFTSNIAQCLALIYQWGFTGAETGGLGRPRSIALVIKRMESALTEALQAWRNYSPPPRKIGSVIQFLSKDDAPPLDGPHFASDEWWKRVENPSGF